MTKKFKRIGGGIHSAIIDGKRVKIRTGDFVTCTPEALGSFLPDYEEVAQPRVEKHRNQPGFVVIEADGTKHPATGCISGQEAQALAAKLAAGETTLKAWEIEAQRLEPAIRAKSVWLSPPKPGGHPGNIKFFPNDLPGLKQVLKLKQSQEFNTEGQAVGELAQAKLALKAAWERWRYECELDSMGRLDVNDPQGEFAEATGYASAALSVLEAEIAEIKRRIKAASTKATTEADDRASRLKFCGISRMRNGVMAEMDGRAVVYPAGSRKPQFADDGMPLEQYLELLKEHQANKQKRRDEERRAEKLKEQQA